MPDELKPLTVEEVDRWEKEANDQGAHEGFQAHDVLRLIADWRRMRAVLVNVIEELAPSKYSIYEELVAQANHAIGRAP